MSDIWGLSSDNGIPTRVRAISHHDRDGRNNRVQAGALRPSS